MSNPKVVGISAYGLSWIGREGGSLESHPYLFLSKNGEDPFITIQKSLHELNDFCITLFDCIKFKAAEQPTFNEAMESAYDDNAYAEVLSSFQFGYAAEDLGRMFSPASSLILLYANLIRSLHIIAKHYGNDQYKAWKTSRDNRGAELSQLVTLLENISKEKLEIFTQPRVRILLDDNMRTLRNDFLHGNWESVERRIVGIGVKSCFEIVSLIMYSLEQKFTVDKFFRDGYTTLA